MPCITGICIVCHKSNVAGETIYYNLAIMIIKYACTEYLKPLMWLAISVASAKADPLICNLFFTPRMSIGGCHTPLNSFPYFQIQFLANTLGRNRKPCN